VISDGDGGSGDGPHAKHFRGAQAGWGLDDPSIDAPGSNAGFGGFAPPSLEQQAPLTPSAPFELWIGHIDRPTTLSNAHWALTGVRPADSVPPDSGSSPDAETEAEVSWVLDIDLDAFMPASFSHRSPPWSWGGPVDGCAPHLYKGLCHRWSSVPATGKHTTEGAEGNCSVWRHADRLFHGISPGMTEERAVEAEAAAEAGAGGIGDECKRQLRGVARQWRGLALYDTGLAQAGAKLSPPELLLWLQAYDRATTDAKPSGRRGSGGGLVRTEELSSFPHFLSRLESMLRGLLPLGLPAAITVARSPDGFTPIETLPYLEAATYAMLARVYGASLWFTLDHF